MTKSKITKQVCQRGTMYEYINNRPRKACEDKVRRISENKIEKWKDVVIHPYKKCGKQYVKDQREKLKTFLFLPPITPTQHLRTN